MSAIRNVTCKRCKEPFQAARADAQFCSSACRQAVYRSRADAQRRRLRARTAARKGREAALRARRAEVEAKARENMLREWTPEDIIGLRSRERIGNLEWAIATCAKIVERGKAAEAAMVELEAELSGARGSRP